MLRDVSAAAPPHPSDAELPTPARGKVLVVDDEVAVLRVYSRALDAEGFQVLCASDGETAEAMFQVTKVDAVVSDVALPGRDGLRLLRAMREMDRDVPVILATASHEEKIKQQAVAAGAMMCFVKPVDLRALVQAVNHATKLHRIAGLMREARRELGTPASADAALAIRFQRALERLWIAYQPIVRWNTLYVAGYEALVRSDEPTLSTPGALFDAAEKLGRTHELGRLIRAKIAAAVADAPRKASIFVNVHGAELEDDRLYEDDAPLHPFAERVVLEITEREPLDRISRLPERMARLRGAGYRIAVDDLGAGYTGLSSFERLQPSIVKLDISLVRDIDKSPLKRRIVHTLATLCRDSGAEMVGEGVETDEERCTLGFHGCYLQQGFAYAPPHRGFAWAVR